jgi:hypothetical protein
MGNQQINVAAPKTINHRVSALSSFYKYLALSAAELRLPIQAARKCAAGAVIGNHRKRHRALIGRNDERLRERGASSRCSDCSPNKS